MQLFEPLYLWPQSDNPDCDWQSMAGIGNIHKNACTEALNQGL